MAVEVAVNAPRFHTVPCKKRPFSCIEHILKDAGRTSTSPTSSPTSTTAHPDGQFEWLNCTRYRPPKLPRTRRRDGPAQRRLGRNPRIPFSPHQVAVLEGRFRRSHYLSSADVADLSTELDLSETRVKIWFQNRRARERRDGEGRSTVSPPQQGVPAPGALAKAAVKVVKAPTPSQLPRSQVSAFSAPKSHVRASPSASPEKYFTLGLDSASAP
ncbi:homeobox protein MSH-D-like [Thrips palmi]|uniref:Homeobox protein MSH-D-like n=1 Tax=Thrips palmi TaxID=161013 RepID=A0A6P8YQ81_THRPL|nr:homeobox protein MSH-D-like [Thrips palmi]